MIEGVIFVMFNMIIFMLLGVVIFLLDVIFCGVFMFCCGEGIFEVVMLLGCILCGDDMFFLGGFMFINFGVFILLCILCILGMVLIF